MKIIFSLIVFVIIVAGFDKVHGQNSCFQILKTDRNQQCKPGFGGSINQVKLANYNFISNKHVCCITIGKETTDNLITYTINDGGSLSKNNLSYPDLISAISEKPNISSKLDVYLDTYGLNGNEQDAIIASCESRVNSRIIANDQELSNKLKDPFFLKDKQSYSVESVSVISKEVKSTKSFYSCVVSLKKGVQNYALKIYANTKEILQNLLGIFNSNILSNKSLSLADLISITKTEMLTKHKISANQFYIEMSDQFGGSMIVLNCNTIDCTI